MRAYLLGQAPEAHAVRLEERLLEDEQIFTTLRSVEDDLFDEYARGVLTGAERERFVERYGSDRGRLLAAQVLSLRSERLPRQSVETATARLPRRSAEGAKAGRQWMPLAAAAMLVTAVGATMWIRDRPANNGPQVRAAAAPQPAIVPAVLLVTLGASRSAAVAPALTLPKEASTLELRVRLDPADKFDRYSVQLRSQSGGLVWHNDDLSASTQNGEPIVVAAVPTASLESGSYELAIRGASGNTTSETLGFATVKVSRTP
jgi:hypothetical protein